ncbi:Methyltransferase domain-containing protein [Friedmanniella luteola]|uniref:Methyltransferase domain-containing protein n=1 Tax=Friedmanniella luteola TaxID=546871 RepID=A0A1H1UR41_9ACTN|nr:class I SAM-dependent methyltransferase [Friedmanniella luteola]SDS74937.1 Methyltransferase domain-containing protein [Friedmanniella luteola]
MDPTVSANRAVWEAASAKHVREFDELLEDGRRGGSLVPVELAVLAPLLAPAPLVVHLQSGHGLDDLDLVRHGARGVVGVDYSTVAAGAAQQRSALLTSPCHYVVAEVPRVPLASGCTDLVYTGKGALIWMRDLDAWAREVARLLRPGGHLVVHEAHPLVPLWTWDADEPRVRPDRSYFARTHVNDSFPAGGAVEWQWSLGELVTALAGAELVVQRLAEHPEPFWRPGGVDAAAWDGRLPNTFTLLAVHG